MASIFTDRELADFVFSEEWLQGTMLFIAGPRQCGKTSLARWFLEQKGCSPLYFNWDIEKIRREYRNDPDFIVKEASRLSIKKPYVVLDEIHKLTRWKNILKGLFDEYSNSINIIVTGSAHLDLLRRSGDSLVGRYTLANLFPFSLREFAQLKISDNKPWLYEDDDWENTAAALDNKITSTPLVPKDIAESYFLLGPFPSPLLSGSMQRSRKWHRDYITLITREDLRDLSGIRELDRVSHLVELLPSRVGSPLSLRNLGVDLEANHSTVKNWLTALQKLFLIWPLRPYSGKIQRTISKESKWYFLDWTYSSNDGNKFENMIASALYQFTVSLQDRGWPEVKLHFVRTYDKKEVDFLLLLDGKPILAVEAKLNAKKINPQLKKLQHIFRNNFPIIQVVNDPGIILKKKNSEYLVGYDRFLMMF